MQDYDLLIMVFLSGFVIAWAIYSLLFQYAERRFQHAVTELADKIEELEKRIDQ